MDVCVVGHVTKDLIRIPGKPDREMAGGSAFYVSAALQSLGLSVEVVTKVAKTDEHLLSSLRDRGVRVLNGATPTTTIFENAYTDSSLATRRQFVRAVADPFTPDDFAEVSSCVFHVGPLTAREVSLSTLRTLRARARTLSFDAQGTLREVVNQAVRLGTWKDRELGLPLIDLLKVDDAEAAALVGTEDVEQAAVALSRLGPREVMITFADRGSLVRAAGRTARIPAIRPRTCVDATGCGDTYGAAFLAARIRGRDAVEAGRYAAAAASLKLENYGPFEGSSEDVERRLHNS